MRWFFDEWVIPICQNVVASMLVGSGVIWLNHRLRHHQAKRLFDEWWKQIRDDEDGNNK